MRVFLVAAITVALVSGAWAEEQDARSSYSGCRVADEREDRRIIRLCDAVDDFNESLGTYDADRHPRVHARLQAALASALLAIGENDDQVALRDSLAAADRAAAAYSVRNRTNTRWAAAKLNAASAMIRLAELGDEAALEPAVPTIREAIAAIKRPQQLELWASAHTTLAKAYVAQSRNGQDKAAVREAVVALQAALGVYRRFSPFEDERERTETQLAELQASLAE